MLYKIAEILRKQSQQLISVFTKYSNLLAYIILGFILIFYASIQIRHFTTGYQEPDPDGYLVLAKRFASFGPMATKDDDMFIHHSHVWVENSRGEVIPKFSPGYPLLMAIFYRLGGDDAMFIVSPLCGGLAIIGAYFLFSLWMSRAASLIAAAFMATNAMILIYTGYLLTHASNVCFVTWGMFFLWKWVRQENVRHGALAGLLLGYAATVRHTSLAMMLVVLAAIGGQFIDFYKNRKDDNSKAFIKTVAVLLGCYAIFPLLLGIYNWSIFGRPWITGYGLSNEQFAFQWGQLKHNIPVLNNGLNYEALFFIFPLGIAGILAVGPIRESLMRLLWFLPIYFVYASYYWGPSGMAYFRFLICAFPVIIGSAFALIDHLSISRKRSSSIPRVQKVIAMLGILVFIIAVRWSDTQRGLRGVVSDPGSRNLAQASHIASEILNEDAIIFSQRPIFCYLGTRRNFRLYDLRIFSTAYGNSAFPENSIPRRQPIRTKRFHDFYQQLNDAQLLDKKRELITSFLSHGRQVAYILPTNTIEKEQNQLGSNFSFSLLKEWDVSSQSEKWGLYEIVHREPL